MTSRDKWQHLADFLNQMGLNPHDAPIPSSLYDDEGNWGIAYKFNGGNARWFTVGGPNLSYIEHRNPRTGKEN